MRVGWSSTLTYEQTEACKKITREHGATKDHGGGESFTVFMYPTCGVPKYLEVRKRNIDGSLLRTWVVTDDK